MKQCRKQRNLVSQVAKAWNVILCFDPVFVPEPTQTVEARYRSAASAFPGQPE